VHVVCTVSHQLLQQAPRWQTAHPWVNDIDTDCVSNNTTPPRLTSKNIQYGYLSSPTMSFMYHWFNSAFHPSGVGKSSTSLHWLVLRWGVFACVGWQVILCDPIRQATPGSSEMDCQLRTYHCFNVFTARCTLVQSAVLRSHVVCLSVCL